MRGYILPTGSSEPAADGRPAPPAEGNLPPVRQDRRQAGDIGTSPRKNFRRKIYSTGASNGLARSTA